MTPVPDTDQGRCSKCGNGADDPRRCSPGTDACPLAPAPVVPEGEAVPKGSRYTAEVLADAPIGHWLLATHAPVGQGAGPGNEALALELRLLVGTAFDFRARSVNGRIKAVAEAVVASDWFADRVRAAKAQGLREAADEMEQIAGSHTSSLGLVDWLRARADHMDGPGA